MPFNWAGAGSGALAGSSAGPWGALAGGVLGGFLNNPQAQNTPAPMPTNYYGMNGSGMFYNPSTGGYTSLDPRMSGADTGSLMKYQQMIDSLTGGKNTVSSYAKMQADQLKTQINDPNTPAAMKTELQNRLNTLNQSAQNTGDWNNPLGAIGVTDPNRQLEFQKQTGTVQDYLKNTLDQNMASATLGQNTANATRGLASSSNAQYGAAQNALNYGVQSGQNAITANDYLRQLQAADEAKKYQMLGVAQTGENSINANQTSQDQLSLNQMMMGMSAGQGYNNNLQAWQRQGAAVDAANKGQTAQQWNTLLGGAMGGLANGASKDANGNYTFDWSKFGKGAAGTMSGTSPNLWGQVASQNNSVNGNNTFNWGSGSNNYNWNQPQGNSNGGMTSWGTV